MSEYQIVEHDFTENRMLTVATALTLSNKSHYQHKRSFFAVSQELNLKEVAKNFTRLVTFTCCLSIDSIQP